ncbi:MAG: universal stress protein [Nitrospirae bacterium]|nr:universal stress protein [Nitrospirota bacterium]
MYQTILVPTDFSDPADEAWRHAVALAKHCGSRVVLLYVVEPVLSHYGVVGLIPSVRELEEQHDIASRLKLKERVEQAEREGLRVEGRIASGKPWQCVVEVAGQLKAELVVMGTHGRTGVAHETLGSTAERVVRQAPCPVMVVRPVGR